MKALVRHAGPIKASAYYDTEGNPHLDIEHDEMVRLEAVLKEKLGREPKVIDLFNYVKEMTVQ